MVSLLRFAVLLLCLSAGRAWDQCVDHSDDCAERAGPLDEDGVHHTGCHRDNDPKGRMMYDCPKTCGACQYIAAQRHIPGFNVHTIREKLRQAEKDEL